MTRLARVLGAVALVLTLAPAAQAQTVGLKHLWTVPGISNDYWGTVISCTNGDTGNANVAVDLYGAGGTFQAGNSILVAPNATVNFTSTAIPNTSIDVNLNATLIAKGHARVFSDDSKVSCSAYLVSISSGVPYVSLTIAKGFKQKGD